MPSTASGRQIMTFIGSKNARTCSSVSALCPKMVYVVLEIVSFQQTKSGHAHGLQMLSVSSIAGDKSDRYSAEGITSSSDVSKRSSTRSWLTYSRVSEPASGFCWVVDWEPAFLGGRGMTSPLAPACPDGRGIVPRLRSKDLTSMLRHQPYYVAKDKAHVTSAETKSTGLIKSSLRIYPTTEQEQAAMDAIYRGLPPRKIHPESAARGSYHAQGRLAGYYHGNEESSHPEEWVLVSPVLDPEADRDEAAYSINQGKHRQPDLRPAVYAIFARDPRRPDVKPDAAQGHTPGMP
jgi:hypothetical protein